MRHTSRPKVLVVEDEQVVAMDLERSLIQLGYTVAGIADTATLALELAEQERPDLVLMDIQLRGGSDGIATAEEIRRRWQMPVVFVTANANEDTLIRAKAAGPYGYLLKPFRVQEINAAILVALHQHRLVRDLFAEHTWLRTTMSSLNDGVIATDQDGSVRYLNPAAEQLTGWSLKDATGLPIEEIWSLSTEQGEPLEKCQLRRALETATPFGKARFLLRTRGGRTVPVEDSAAPILAGQQVLGAVTVVVDITERVRLEREKEAERGRLEEEVHATSEALGQTRAEIRALAAQLMTAQEQERRRVARELHDDLAQRAAVAEMRLGELGRLLGPGNGVEELRAVQTVLAELSEGLRQVSHRLHPSVIDDLGLVHAMASFIDEQRRLGIELSFHAQQVPDRIPPDVATALYRVAQEAVRNAVKHGHGAPVRITLAARNRGLVLTVEDAGPGFDMEKVRGQGGLGLLSIQERARLVGGSLAVRSRPGDGTLIVVRVPLAEGGTTPDNSL